MAKKRVGVDKGHGPDTSGKRTDIFTDGTVSPLTGKNFMHEWEFNKAVGDYLIIELQRCGFDTVDISPSLNSDKSINDRYKTANANKVDLFVSIHANANTGKWGSANGIETLVRKAEASFTSVEKARILESIRIGKIVNDELVSATGLRNRCSQFPSKVLERDNIGVLNWTKMPAILTEGGFMDNLKEAKLLLSDDYRRLYAASVAKGICKAFNYTYVEAAKPVTIPIIPKVEVKPVKKAITKFTDVPAGHWAEDGIKIASDAGILNGVDDDTFGLGINLTREQAAIIVANMIKYVDSKLNK
jgi:N-acetylmuramoyl-L-alanine amidase